MTEQEISRLLSGFSVLEFLSPAAVLRQIDAFHEWLQSRWPGVRPYAEIAVRSVLESGQVQNGRIDLLLETDTGRILIDHKSSQLSSDHWGQLADNYWEQMDFYAAALEAFDGRSVTEKWLFLPVAAGGVLIR